MWSASGFFGVAAFLLALAGFSGGSVAQARDDAVARESQFELASPQRPEAGPAPGARVSHDFNPLTDDFWPLAEDGRNADVDVKLDEFVTGAGAAEAEPLSPAGEIAADGGEEDRSGPVNFPISKSVKIKAQPLGGGLGGRVTFTFLLPTGD